MTVKSPSEEGYTTVKRWLENRAVGKRFAEYLLDHGYRSIAIYGAGDLGVLLYNEINHSPLKVRFFVDRNYEGIREINGIPVVAMESFADDLSVDALIVTPAGVFDDVCDELMRISPETAIIGLRDAVYEI